jgi:hypothetical protein
LPFSDSVRIAVDKSSARGESLGKACIRLWYNSKIKDQKYVLFDHK